MSEVFGIRSATYRTLKAWRAVAFYGEPLRAKKVAEAAGCSGAWVRDLECNAASPRVNELKNLARAYRLTQQIGDGPEADAVGVSEFLRLLNVPTAALKMEQPCVTQSV